jgi:thiamine-phosphate pyrophosphorylase
MPAEGGDAGVDPDAVDVVVLTSKGVVPGRGHLDVARAAIAGGADVVQVRAPELADAGLEGLARGVVEACRGSSTLSIVNDRVEVAVAAGAAGVHVGQGDGPELVRSRIGDRVLGVSVSTPEEARRAAAFGADYLGVTVWATPTKPEAEPVGLDGLAAVARSTSLPVVGIGGVSASNATEVLDAGARGVAVVSAVGAARDMEAATRELVEIVIAWKKEHDD